MVMTTERKKIFEKFHIDNVNTTINMLSNIKISASIDRAPKFPNIWIVCKKGEEKLIIKQGKSRDENPVPHRSLLLHCNLGGR